jgi:hypothetical protein
MVQGVGRWPVTAEVRFQSQVNSCEICGGQSRSGIRSSLNTSVFPCPYHSTNVVYSSSLDFALIGGTKARSLGTFQKAVLLKKSGSIAQESTFPHF